MRSDTDYGPRRVALLGPIRIAELASLIPALSTSGHAIPQGMGGSCLAHLVRVRSAQGLHTDVVTLDPDLDEPLRRWDGARVRLWVVRRRRAGALRDGFRQECRLLRQALSQSDAEVCHANWTYEYGMAAVFQSLMPSLVTLHDHAWNILKWAGARYLPMFVVTCIVVSRMRHATAVSPHAAAFARRFRRMAIPIIPNTLDKTLVPTAARATPPAPRVFSALVWTPLKNVQRALQAFHAARLAVPTASYVLCGPGLENSGPASRWAGARGLADGVTFLGNRPHREVLKLMAESTVVFHPSLEDALPGPVAEAMAIGVPVLACREAGGSRWLLDDGRAGTLVSGRELNSMSRALVAQLLPVTGSSRCACAFGRVWDLCSPDRVLRSYGECYRACMAGLPAPRQRNAGLVSNGESGSETSP